MIYGAGGRVGERVDRQELERVLDTLDTEVNSFSWVVFWTLKHPEIPNCCTGKQLCDYDLECQNDVLELKLRAERRLGELWESSSAFWVCY